MTNPFEQIAKNQKEQSIEKKEEDKGMFTKTQIKTWINEAKKPKKSSISAIFVGHPKSGKTGVALDCRTEDDKKANKRIIAIELNSDQGCDVCRKEHYNNDPNIIVLNPREYSTDKDGKFVPDYIKTMEKIKATLQELRDNLDEYNLKAVVFDGLDIFLGEICEQQMRADEHVDVSGGLSQRFWKKRNDYYFQTLNLLFDIDVDKYFITHYAPKRRNDKTGDLDDDRYESKLNNLLVFACQKSTPDKMHQIVEFTDNTKIVKGIKQVELVATIISDRRSLDSHMTPIIFAKTGEDGKVKWTGQAILERK